MDSNQPNWARSKTFVKSIICCKPVGYLLGMLYRNRVPFHGALIDVKSANIPSQNKALLFWGLYENAERRFVQKYLLSNLDVVEVGSSVGAISSQIAKRLDPDRRLICVEGNPRLQESLATNLQLNCGHLDTEISSAAIAYGDAEVDFWLSADNLRSHRDRQYGDMEQVKVPTLTLGSLLKERNIGDYQLVADIEGAELDILDNDGDALATCKRVVIELHETVRGSQTISVAKLRSKFEALGFVVLEQYGRVIAFEKRCS